MKPKRHFELPLVTLFKPLGPLYGLSYAGDNWRLTFAQHLTDDLYLKQTTADLALFFKTVDQQLQGIAGTYVDDSILARDVDFLKLTDQTLDKFESRKLVMDNFTLAGTQIETLPVKHVFYIHQQNQTTRLQLLSADADYCTFKFRIMKLVWLVHTRPSIACTVTQAAEVTAESYSLTDMKPANSAI